MGMRCDGGLCCDGGKRCDGGKCCNGGKCWDGGKCCETKFCNCHALRLDAARWLLLLLFLLMLHDLGVWILRRNLRTLPARMLRQ